MIFALISLLSAASADALPPAPDAEDVTDEDDARARELFQNGADLYDEGRYEDAIVAWQEAWRLSGRPLLLFNIANATERLGRWQETMDLLSRYRAFAPADERETLDRRIRNIERRLDEAPTVAPTTPFAESVAPEPRRLPVLPLALFGAGGLSLVTGTVFGVAALASRADAEAECTESGGASWCPESAAAALASDRQNALFADIAFGVGAAAVAGGVITLLLPSRPVQVGLVVGADGGMLTLRGELP